jgi:alpha-tubulin suppressor-like RCC1 family protein
MALRDDGTVWTWGDNQQGKLGLGSVTLAFSSKPQKVTGLSSIVAISAGTGHALALKSDGTVWVWGQNFGGDLGIGTQDFVAHPTPVALSLSQVVKIFAGDGVSYVIKSDGSVWGWGFGTGGLGDGTSGSPRTSPVQLTNLQNLAGLGSGPGWNVIMKQDNTVWSFGSNFSGRLGRGIVGNVTDPVVTQISGLNAKSVGSGRFHSLVVQLDGSVKVFGANDSGQLGKGNTDSTAHRRHCRCRASPELSYRPAVPAARWSEIRSPEEQSGPGAEIFLACWESERTPRVLALP